MEARKLEFTQNETIVPFTKKKEIDMSFAIIANKRADLRAREKAEREYSAGCKRNKRNSIIDMEDVWCFLSALSMCGLLISMYFLGCIL